LEYILRSPVAAAIDRPRHAGLRRPRRFVAVVVVLFAAFLVAGSPVAQAMNGGRAGTGAGLPPVAKATPPSLRYSNFLVGAATCGTAGFSVDATVSTDIVGLFSQSGRTLLDGVQFDTYTLPDDTGPFVDDTNFSRSFSPPPPASSTWEFVYLTTIVQGGRQLGVSRTTIRCTSGILSASSQWIPAYAEVPVGTPAGLAWLAALLALAAFARLRKPLA
jgi:hypothetical protein